MGERKTGRELYRVRGRARETETTSERKRVTVRKSNEETPIAWVRGRRRVRVSERDYNE